MKKKEISWKPGYRAKVDAEVAHKELERVKKENENDLKPEDVVSMAKPKSNPIHVAFEWDDGRAGHEWRLSQARTMIRSIQVVYVKGPKQPSRLYEIVSKEKQESGPPRKVYRSIEDILDDPVARNALLSRAVRDLVNFQARYHKLQELSAVFRSLDETLATLEL